MARHIEHMKSVSPTRFTIEELQLISRALNSYTPKQGLGRRDANMEINDSANLETRIYRENFRIGMDNEPPLYKDADSLQDILDHVSPPPARDM